MPWKMHGGGTFRIDKRYPVVGRVAIASGTTNKKVYDGILLMFEDLAEKGRYDDLQSIKSGAIKPTVAYNLWKNGKLKGSELIELTLPFSPTVYDWLATHDVVAKTKAGYRNNLKQLEKLTKKSTPIRQLPTLLRTYRTQCQTAGTGRVFNHTRATCLAFLHAKFGKHASIYQEVSDIQLLKAPKQRKNNPLSVKEFDALCSKLRPNVADMIRSMCFNGMGWTEYERTWSVLPDRVHINGTKNDNRDRDVPLVFAPTKPVLRYKRFLEIITEASDGKVKPYDFRRTYATWMEAAEIPRIRRQLYLGHRAQDITDLYETVDVTKFLVDDAKTMKKWIKDQRKA